MNKEILIIASHGFIGIPFLKSAIALAAQREEEDVRCLILGESDQLSGMVQPALIETHLQSKFDRIEEMCFGVDYLRTKYIEEPKNYINGKVLPKLKHRR